MGKHEGKYNLKDHGVDGCMGSNWTSGRLVGSCGVDSPGSGYGSLVGGCECSDEPSGSDATELVSNISWLLNLVCLQPHT
jgi:hypothetical protein